MQLGELRTNREARPRPTSEKDMRGLGNSALDPSNLVGVEGELQAVSLGDNAMQLGVGDLVRPLAEAGRLGHPK
jgi:hypothetical protein